MSLLAVVLDKLSPEARGLIGAVVELARGADHVGPPSPPENIVRWSRQASAGRVPWQLVAAAIAIEGPDAAERVPQLLEAVEEHGTVSGLLTWSGKAESILVAFLAFTARGLDPEGLERLREVFG